MNEFELILSKLLLIYCIFQMFFIDHTAKTTSFIDPRMPNDLPLLPGMYSSTVANKRCMEPGVYVFVTR